MTILVFGKSGQVATELQRYDDVRAVGRDEADLTQPEVCAELIRSVAPTAIINAAAYTAVDKAETEADLAHLVNGEAPGAMARAAAVLGIPFVHISTDYVFDGTGEVARKPDEATGPLGVYGQSKLAGEEAVIAAGGTYAILRTSWVYSAHGNNFLKTMLRLSETRDALNIVADQIGGPTPAGAIADACHSIAEQLASGQGQSGIYHFSGAPDASWADFARDIFEQSGRTVAVGDITTAEYPTPAQRPLNSRLDCTSLSSAFGIDRPDWKSHTRSILSALGVK